MPQKWCCVLLAFICIVPGTFYRLIKILLFRTPNGAQLMESTGEAAGRFMSSSVRLWPQMSESFEGHGISSAPNPGPVPDTRYVFRVIERRVTLHFIALDIQKRIWKRCEIETCRFASLGCWEGEVPTGKNTQFPSVPISQPVDLLPTITAAENRHRACRSWQSELAFQSDEQ